MLLAIPHFIGREGDVPRLSKEKGTKLERDADKKANIYKRKQNMSNGYDDGYHLAGTSMALEGLWSTGEFIV